QNKLKNFPAPTGALAGQLELNNLAAEKKACVKAVEDAETEDAIEEAFAEGLAKLAAYLIEGAASVAVRWATAQGATIPANAAPAVTAAKTILKKATKGDLACQVCDQRLQTVFATFYFWQKQRKREVTQARTDVGTARTFIDSTK